MAKFFLSFGYGMGRMSAFLQRDRKELNRVLDQALHTRRAYDAAMNARPPRADADKLDDALNDVVDDVATMRARLTLIQTLLDDGGMDRVEAWLGRVSRG